MLGNNSYKAHIDLWLGLLRQWLCRGQCTHTKLHLVSATIGHRSPRPHFIVRRLTVIFKSAFYNLSPRSSMGPGYRSSPQVNQTFSYFRILHRSLLRRSLHCRCIRAPRHCQSQLYSLHNGFFLPVAGTIRILRR